MVHHIENGQIISEVLNTDKLVVIDFFAEWCGPCKMLTPIINELDKKYSEDAIFYKVNIDESQEPAIVYGVSAVPTLIFFKNGEEIDRQVGFIEEEKLSKIIDELK